MGVIEERIRGELLAWPGVTAEPHRFGGVEFRFAGREIGHLHGDRLADLPFPVKVRHELVAAGRAAPHHVMPESGWVSRWIHGPEDVPDVIALFRLQYDRLAARSHGAPAQAGAQAADGRSKGTARPPAEGRGAAEAPEVETVRAWHEALNDGDVGRLVSLSVENVALGGPRGTGRGVHLPREWFGRAGMHVELQQMYRRGGTVVVDQAVQWRDPVTGEVRGAQTAATVFVVRDGRVASVTRYPDRTTALAAVGLSDGDKV